MTRVVDQSDAESPVSSTESISTALPPPRIKGGGVLRALATTMHAMRLHQWVKNLLVFVPVFTSHRMAVVSELGEAWISPTPSMIASSRSMAVVSELGEAWIILLICLMAGIIHLLTVGSTIYRLPLEMLLAIPVGVAVTHLAKAFVAAFASRPTERLVDESDAQWGEEREPEPEENVA